MKIQFKVEGYPPKKHGDKSMWSRAHEAPLLVSLREKALHERAEANLNDCFRNHIGLELILYIPSSELETIGDLDNFITGICDGLQAANANAIPYIHPTFKESKNEHVHPRHSILLENDSKIIYIKARKIGIEDSDAPYYTVILEELTLESHAPAKGIQ